MDALTRLLARYAEYHRDRRNIATHLVGIPLIVVALAMLLSRPAWHAGSLPLTPALLAGVAGSLYYLRIEWRMGLAMTVQTLLWVWLGQALAAAASPWWVAWALGLFTVGWAFQFVGHAYEGRKPAFLDDVRSLLVGPLFVTAEVAFALGLRREVQRAIEAHAGPTRGRAPRAPHPPATV